MNDPLFTPFEPSPSTAPDDPKTPAAAETPKRKRGRPSTKPPETMLADVENLPIPDKVAAAGKVAASKKAQRSRSTGSVRTPVGLSLPVSRVLAAVKDLHGDDTTLFEKLLGILAAAGKGQRERVIAALGKVFS